MTDRYFTQQTFEFLAALSENNDRNWFEAHQQDYERVVRIPALAFIRDMSDEMPAISAHFTAQSKKVGGSLIRIYRDTRFSRDKTPYKTNIGIQFRHAVGKDIHAPGYYLHIAPDACFIGVGLWHPDTDALFKIRERIVQHGDEWLAARDELSLRTRFAPSGDSLANAPRGFAKDHPLLEDLKRKDFICIAPLSQTIVTSGNLCSQVVEHCRQAAPYMRFLCSSLALPF